ncbi:MAG TPA: bifunctional lysylphosphatidylglycerol flippase/synthetase MprF [Gemmatimonadaceae bacterium]|nr:bifunctional lysylphosphatidylglycerol flippase/synthetase MprF [Gemmatimonadaceae bacterium]
MKFRLSRAIAPAAMTIAVGVALYLLDRDLKLYHYRDLMRQVWVLPHSHLALALLLTAVAYAVLPGYDAIALSYVDHPLPIRRIAFGSFIAYALSHSLGFPLLSGGPVRYRFWSVWGLSTSEIAQAISFAGATFIIGMIAVAGGVFLLEPRSTIELLHLPVSTLKPFGVVCLLVVAGYLVLSTTRYKTFRLFEWEFPVPSMRLALAQLGVAVVDWSAAGAVLYVLLPSGYRLSFLPVLGVFLIAQFAGILSHVPGGLGVFEAIVVLLLGSRVPAASIVGALVAYRFVYYLLPLVLALSFLIAFEVQRQRDRVAEVATLAGGFVGRWIPAILPQILGIATFVAGVILIVSGATPAARGRVSALDAVLQLGIIELSHFAASLAGAALVILAWSIRRRLDAAYSLTIAVLAIGIVTSLLKGLDWEEAFALTIVLAALIPSRRVFYRKTAIMSEPFSYGWIAAIVVVGVVTSWLAFFSYRNLDLTSTIWLQFSGGGGDAPRSLRAMIGVLGALMLFALTRKLRHAEAEPEVPSPRQLDIAARIASSSPETIGNLALLGDKSLLFSDSGKSMIMYGVAGRSWIALGDPIGIESERSELAWRFRESADRHGGWPVFYEVSARHLPIYIDLGLTLFKLGEEAMIPLADFSLEGGSRKALRRTRKDACKAGATFEMIPAEDTAAFIPVLKQVSDEWLASKRTKEKGFSLGRFDERYLRTSPAALIRVGDAVVAFANVWLGADRTEISVDLMRYTSVAPPGVMEFLLIELMLWGKANGYQRFNLGMAPLSGIENRSLAPLWNRVGALLFSRGEPFYNFQGLRLYKEKFDPIWEPRYLASPGGLVLPRILTNVASLISGGLAGVVSR